MIDLFGEYGPGDTVMLAAEAGQEIIVMELAISIEGDAVVSVDFDGGQNLIFSNVSMGISSEKKNYRYRAGGSGRDLKITVDGTGLVRTEGRAFIATPGQFFHILEGAVPGVVPQPFGIPGGDLLGDDAGNLIGAV